MAVDGYTVQEIANELDRSIFTVQDYCRRNQIELAKAPRKSKEHIVYELRDYASEMREIANLVKDRMPGWVRFDRLDGGRRGK